MAINFSKESAVEHNLEVEENIKRWSISQALRQEMLICKEEPGVVNAERALESEKCRKIMEAEKVEAAINALVVQQNRSYFGSLPSGTNRVRLKTGKEINHLLKKQIIALQEAASLARKEYNRERRDSLQLQYDNLVKAFKAAVREFKDEKIEINVLRM